MRRAPRERGVIEQLAQQLQLRSRDLVQAVGDLSGGNQQKVMIGRWLAAGIDTLLVEQPTRGVDVGAKAEIYSIIHKLAQEGRAILVISSELVELIGLCHRAYVISEGRITGEVAGSDMTEQKIMSYAIPRRVTEKKVH